MLTLRPQSCDMVTKKRVSTMQLHGAFGGILESRIGDSTLGDLSEVWHLGQRVAE